MEKREILRELIKHYADGKKSVFANKLGISPQAVSTWESRNTFDIDLIFSKCEDLNAQWLLSGEGEMLLTAPGEEQAEAGSRIPAHEDGLLSDRLLILLDRKDELICRQAEEIGRLRERISRLQDGK